MTQGLGSAASPQDVLNDLKAWAPAGGAIAQLPQALATLQSPTTQGNGLSPLGLTAPGFDLNTSLDALQAGATAAGQIPYLTVLLEQAIATRDATLMSNVGNSLHALQGPIAAMDPALAAIRNNTNYPQIQNQWIWAPLASAPSSTWSVQPLQPFDEVVAIFVPFVSTGPNPPLIADAIELLDAAAAITFLTPSPPAPPAVSPPSPPTLPTVPNLPTSLSPLVTGQQPATSVASTTTPTATPTPAPATSNAGLIGGAIAAGALGTALWVVGPKLWGTSSAPAAAAATVANPVRRRRRASLSRTR
jgi:hypothetical protein